MKHRLQTLAVVGGYLGVAIILLRQLLTGGTPGLIYDWAYRLLPGTGEWSILSMWNTANGGGTDLYRTSFYFDLLYKGVLELGVHNTQFFIVASLLLSALCGFGMYLLVKSYNVRPIAAILAGLFYQTSALLLIRLTAGYYGFLISAAFFPLLILAYNLAVLHWDTTKRYIALAVLAALFSFCQIHFLAFFVMIIATQSVLALRERKHAGRYLGVGGLVLLGYALTNLFWIVPSGGSAQSALTATGFTEQAFVTRIESLPHVFWNFLFLTDHGITEEMMVAVNSWWPRALLLTLLVVLTGYGAWRYRKGRNTVLLAGWLVALVIPLSTATAPPFGEVFSYLFTHIPVLKLFREVYHLEYLLLFSYTLLLGFASNYALERMQGWRVAYQRLTLVSIVLGILLFNAPSWFNLFGYWGTTAVPTGAAAANREVAAQTKSHVFYPPNLGFWQVLEDDRLGANYPDQLAYSFDNLPVSQASSDLDTRRAIWKLRNAATNSFMFKDEALPTYLRLLNSDTAVVRDAVTSRYWRSVDLHFRRKELVHTWIAEPLLTKAASQPSLASVYEQDGFHIFRTNQSAQEIYLVNSLNLICSLDNLPATTQAFITDPSSPLQPFAQSACVDQPVDRLVMQTRPLASVTNARALAHTATLGWSPGFLSFYESPLFSDTLFDFIFTRIPNTTSLTLKPDDAAEAVYLSSPQSGMLRIGNTIVDTKGPDFTWNKIALSSADTSLNTLEVESITGENGFAGVFTATNLPIVSEAATPLAPSTDLLVRKQSATEYLVTLPDTSTEPRVLTFLQNFDARWELVQGDQVIKPEQVNGYANGYLIPANASGTFTLQFTPQKNYLMLILLSGSITLLLAGYYLLTLRPERRNGVRPRAKQ